MAVRLIVEGPLHPDGQALLDSRADIDYEILTKPDVPTFAAKLKDADALILRLSPLPADAFEAAEKLKVVSRGGVGYDHVDVDALTRKGVPLAIVGDTLSVSVAEHTLLLMLAAARRSVVMDQLNRKADYSQRHSGGFHELYQKTVLLVGYGKIGRATAKRCAGFEMNIIASGRPRQRDEIEAAGYRYVTDFHDALGEADFVSLHIPGQPGGVPVMGRDEFAAMKPGAFVINTSRGSLIDEDALYDALTSGHLAGAGLDVTRQEPPAPDLSLLKLDSIVFSPHYAALTDESQSRVSRMCVQNVFDALDGKLNPDNVVNGVDL